MSRIGKLPIDIPQGVTVTVNPDNTVIVKGPKGELSQNVGTDITVNVGENQVTLERHTEDKSHKAQHGLYRALVHNMVVGVSEGYTIKQELVGVGYRANAEGQVLELGLGYSHGIFLVLPKEVKVSVLWRVVISNLSVRLRRKFVHSVNRSLTRVKVLNLWVKFFVVRLVSRLKFNHL